MYFQYYDLATQNHSHFFEIETPDGLFNSNTRFSLEFFSSLTPPIIFTIKMFLMKLKLSSTSKYVKWIGPFIIIVFYNP
jgi:hypothetical protein